MTDDVELQSPSVNANKDSVLRLFSAPKKKPKLVAEPSPEQQALNKLLEAYSALLRMRTKVERMHQDDEKNNSLDELKIKEEQITAAIQRAREIQYLREFSLTEKPSKDRHHARIRATELGSQILRTHPQLRAYVHCALELTRLESHLFSFGHKAKRRAGFAMLAALSSLQNPPADLGNELVDVKYLGRREKTTLFAKNNGVAKLLKDFKSRRRGLSELPLSTKEKSPNFLYG